MCLDQAEIVTKFNFRPMAALYLALYDNGDTGKHAYHMKVFNILQEISAKRHWSVYLVFRLLILMPLFFLPFNGAALKQFKQSISSISLNHIRGLCVP